MTEQNESLVVLYLNDGAGPYRREFKTEEARDEWIATHPHFTLVETAAPGGDVIESAEDELTRLRKFHDDNQDQTADRLNLPTNLTTPPPAYVVPDPAAAPAPAETSIPGPAETSTPRDFVNFQQTPDAALTEGETGA